MNKKKVAICAIILIVIIAIIVIIVSKVSNGSKIEKLYESLSENNQYEFSMKNEDNYEITVAKKDNQTCIDMDNNGERTTTLIKDNTTYLIIHSNREYYVYDSDIAEENIVTEMFQQLIDVEHNTGKEKIRGNNLKYEEYEGFAGFMTSTAKDLDESDVKTRFYFDKDNLKYIKTIVDNEEELLDVDISYEVDDNLFEIPSDYAEAN
jgi:hypothetical protein